MTGPINLDVSPYFDDFDPSKQYVGLLGVPGRVEQARDFTQLQTILRYLLQNLSESLMKNGDIQSGMDYYWTGNTLTVEDGKVYLDGVVQDFHQQTITLTKNGTELVGVKTQANIITEAQDSSFFDPATGQANYGQPGSHRIQYVPVLTLNDSTASTIYTFQNGELAVQVTKPDDSTLNDILAKRTYDQSGNYLVNGMSLDVDPYDANDVQVTVNAGTAYVQGYQIIKPTPVKQVIPISSTYQTVTAEPKTYVSGTSSYALNNYPARQIDQVVAVVSSTATMTRGAQANGLDYLPHTSVVAITSIVSGSTTYVLGTDFQLTDDAVDWSLAGSEPASGATYTCVYSYNKTMVSGTDYEMQPITDQWGNTLDYITFLNGDIPVNQSQFNITYDYYLSRIDVISLDQNGNVVVTTGTPAIDRLVQAPSVDTVSLLQLGNVYLPANSLSGKIQFNTVNRLTMNDLQVMMKRLEVVEMNQAIEESDREAMAGENPSDLMGVFSDNFKSTTKGDLTNPLFTAMYDIEEGRIMLPLESETDITPEIDLGNSAATIYSTLISSPMTEYVAINQPYATTSELVDPFLAFNTTAMITLSPSTDNWIDTSTITIENVDFEAKNLYRWWAHSGSYQTNMLNNDQSLFDMNAQMLTGGSGSLSNWRPTYHESGTAVATSSSQTEITTAETYMRQITITVSGTNFLPNADNLTLYFDGVKCDLIPSSGYSAGTNSGTVRANASGNVSATFTNPANIRTGTREVVLQNDSNVASASYTSIGTQETVVDTVLKTVISLYAVDPLAQSFQFDQDTIVSSVGLFFSSKGTTDNVTVQIRNIDAGVPGSIIYAQKVLTPSDIVVSTDTTGETKVTFDDPIYCYANSYYAIVVEAGTVNPGLFTCQLGGTDINSGQIITNTPYLAGEMYMSKNADAWNIYPKELFKFKVYASQFASTGTVQFSQMSNVDADRLVMMADYLTPQNTGCYWEVNVNNQGWQAITTYQELDLQFQASTVVLRATFQASQNISPLLTQENFTLMGFLTAETGTYVSRNCTLDYPYTSVRESIVAYIPQGATVTPQFSYDNGNTWITPTLQSQSSVSSTLTQYNYEASISSSVNAENFRSRINIQANTPFIRPEVDDIYCVMT